jgi:hypothetical protein
MSRRFVAKAKGGWRIAIVASFAWLAGPPTSPAQEPVTLEAEAPANHSVWKHTLGGAYFVAKDLKDEYDALLAKVDRLKELLATGTIAGDQALRELEQLEPQLVALREKIDAQKALVSPVHVQTQTEELSFTLGPEQRLIVSADDLRVVGWDEPQVKVVLEKTLLAAAAEPEEAEFAALKLVHRQVVATELVGRTPAEIEAEEQVFLNEKRDVPLTAEQIAGRAEFVKQIADSYAPFRDYQGKEVDVVDIEGLTHEQGNRQVTVEITSPGGGGTMGSDWRRHARLTVYVPKCQGVLLRGCLKGLAIEGVEAPLTVTDAGSLDRDYDGRFTIENISGPLALYNVPLDELKQVRGDVTIVATVEYANTGTTHEGGRRVAYTPPPRECSIEAVEGDLSAWFSRVDLTAAEIGGKIDIRNETGTTQLRVANAQAAAHRVVSESGRIELNVPSDQLAALALMALTSDGAADTNADQAALDEVSFTTGLTIDGSRRNWRGFMTPPPEEERFTWFERPAQVLAGRATQAGLTLISRSGRVGVQVE